MMHDKTGLLHLTEIMSQRGYHHLVISPGSRNAPIVTVFANRPEFKCYTIVDERSAAFFALGMAQQSGQPVAVACTSGTAVLNYAPALAEAFYQRIPLLVLTADRPVEWVDQGDGQTIRQRDAFGPHVKLSVELPQAPQNNDDLWYNDRLISKAMNALLYPAPGPVHINLPFSEPLYGFDHRLESMPKDVQMLQPEAVLGNDIQNELASLWIKSNKKLVLVGQHSPDRELEKLLARLAQRKDVVVLTETTSNVFDAAFISCIDRCLAVTQEKEQFRPDLLLTLGGPIVSKRVKSFLRKSPIITHINLDVADPEMDTYQKLTHALKVTPVLALAFFAAQADVSQSNFSALWQQASSCASTLHQTFIESHPYSDLTIFDKIVQSVPAYFDLQLANSTPVRYAQLFDWPFQHRFDANRGTSGIDGSLSTAAGAAMVSGKPTLLISGDLGFLYDSNGLWNKHLPHHLKVIVINNGGGGIFRFIEGPAKTGFLEPFFEARHRQSAEYIAKAFGVTYFSASDATSLDAILPLFFEAEGATCLLEIHSPPEESGLMIRGYFDSLSRS